MQIIIFCFVYISHKSVRHFSFNNLLEEETELWKKEREITDIATLHREEDAGMVKERLGVRSESRESASNCELVTFTPSPSESPMFSLPEIHNTFLSSPPIKELSTRMAQMEEAVKEISKNQQCMMDLLKEIRESLKESKEHDTVEPIPFSNAAETSHNSAADAPSSLSSAPANQDTVPEIPTAPTVTVSQPMMPFHLQETAQQSPFTSFFPPGIFPSLTQHGQLPFASPLLLQPQSHPQLQSQPHPPPSLYPSDSYLQDLYCKFSNNKSAFCVHLLKSLYPGKEELLSCSVNGGKGKRHINFRAIKFIEDTIA